MPLAAKGQFYTVGLLHLLAIDGCTLGINMNYYTTKAVRGPITKFNQSDYLIAGPIFSKYQTGYCPECVKLIATL